MCSAGLIVNPTPGRGLDLDAPSNAPHMQIRGPDGTIVEHSHHTPSAAASSQMGNQPSRTPTSSNPQSPTHHGSQGSVASSHGQHSGPVKPASHHVHHPRRRESIQALSIKAANAAPPATSLESATIHPTPAHPSRARSATIAAAAAGPPSSTTTSSTLTNVASQLRATQDSFRPTASDDKMGNEQSRQKGRDHKRTVTPPNLTSLDEKPSPSPQTRPVAVPSAPREEPQPAPLSSLEPADASQDYFAPSSQFSRPPRLPLPIEEEVHTPGSPILSPADITSPIYPNEAEGVLPRRTSVLSSTTAEDDDLGEEFKGPQGQPTIPTLIEWEGPGERVYVTGTFAGWNRKYKLHRNGPSKKKDVLSAMVNIVPGTHHLKFIVDGDMTTSDKLPTAVDYTNILVNYLEVSVDDIPNPVLGVADEPKPSDPIAVEDQRAPLDIYPPQLLPPSPEAKPIPVPVPKAATANIPTAEPSPRKYHDSIPRYLLDLDEPEESSRWQRANAAASGLPTPPTLPLFLSKSILNGTTPMKDDSSVLIMPNHTVLNHLATSSIKDNILATSGTTRYKQKFLTTIMYKPKHDDGAEH